MTRSVKIIDWPFALVALVLGLALYWPALTGEPVYDDIMVYQGNALIGDMANLRVLFSSEYFASAGEQTYRPLLTITYFLDRAVWCGSAFGPRLTNLLLHVIASCFVLAAFRRIGRLGRGAAWFGALIFLAHPVSVEAVASVGNREEVLAACIYLAVILLMHRASRGEGSEALNYLLATMLFISGLFVMEMIITLPASLMVIRALDRAEEEEPQAAWQSAVRGTIAFWVVALIYMLAIRSLITQERAEESLVRHGGYMGILATIPGVLLTYLRMVIWPSGLAADYAETTGDFSRVSAWAALIFWAATALWTARAVIKRDRRALAPALFLICIAPFMQIIPFWILMADRYLYLPMVPLIGAASYIASELFNYSKDSGVGKRARAACAATALLAFGGMTSHRAGLWGDNLALWRDGVGKQPASTAARFNYASSLLKHGRAAEAAEQYVIVLGMDGPNDGKVSSLANALIVAGDGPRAERALRIGLDRWPNSEKLFFMLGARLLSMGRAAEADALVAPFLDSPPRSARVLEVLALWAQFRGGQESRVRYMSLLGEVDPDDAMLHQILGRLSETNGMPAEAARHYYIICKHASDQDVRSQACSWLMGLRKGRERISGCGM